MKIEAKQAQAVFYEHEALFEQASSVIFYSKSLLDYRLNLLKTRFRNHCLHSIAIKTCNHPEVLKHIINSGFGLEAASIEEVRLAIAAGCPPNRIVFDSPVKTKAEILECHESYPGITLNANSIQELDRYPIPFNGTVGLRINPLVDNEANEMLNVSTPHSKFGVPINQIDLQDFLIQNTHIACIHIHIGSQIADFRPNISAIKKTLEVIEKVNTAREKEGSNTFINVFDIGGGLDFELENDHPYSLDNFTKQINKLIPDHLKLITEYGHFIHHNNSFVASRVEYVTPRSDIADAVYIHVGADLFVRKVYSKMAISYPISVIQKQANEKKEVYDIYGPLCFAGDQLYSNIELPVVQEGDIICIHDIGANTFSMWSEHCGRTKPSLIFY